MPMLTHALAWGSASTATMWRGPLQRGVYRRPKSTPRYPSRYPLDSATLDCVDPAFWQVTVLFLDVVDFAKSCMVKTSSEVPRVRDLDH